MSSHVAVRMCPECRTTDAHFPNIDGCPSCASMLSQEENIFWNTPLYLEEKTNDKGEVVDKVGVMPKDVMRQVRIPWYVNLFRMIMLE